MTKLLPVVLLVAAFASPSYAQAQAPAMDRVYVSGSVFGDIKRFSGDVDEPVLNGQGLGGGITVGTSLHPRWDLQLGVDVPTFTSTSREHNVTFQRDIITLQSVTENQTLSVSALVRFHGASERRVQVGYLAGLSIVRLRRDFHTNAPPDTPPSLVPRPAASVGYASAPTLGMDAQVTLTSHVSLVPGIRATVFRFSDTSGPDTSGITLRPRLALRWTF